LERRRARQSSGGGLSLAAGAAGRRPRTGVSRRLRGAHEGAQLLKLVALPPEEVADLKVFVPQRRQVVRRLLALLRQRLEGSARLPQLEQHLCLGGELRRSVELRHLGPQALDQRSGRDAAEEGLAARTGLPAVHSGDGDEPPPQQLARAEHLLPAHEHLCADVDCGGHPTPPLAARHCATRLSLLVRPRRLRARP